MDKKLQELLDVILSAYLKAGELDNKVISMELKIKLDQCASIVEKELQNG